MEIGMSLVTRLGSHKWLNCLSRDPSFCNKLLGRLHRETLAPYAREAIPITPIIPKAQHPNVMGVIVPRVIASTYHAPPKDLSLIPSTSHTRVQSLTPEQSTHCASIYTPNAISRRDTMSPIDHSMRLCGRRCPQRAKPSSCRRLLANHFGGVEAVEVR